MTKTVTKTLTGWSLIGVSLLIWAYNMSDTIADLRTWHGATQPDFIAAGLKQLGTVVFSALGGSLLQHNRS